MKLIRRSCELILVVLSALLLCSLGALADDPFAFSKMVYNAEALGLEAGAPAPLLEELGVLGSGMILVLFHDGGTNEVVAVRRVAEVLGLPTIVAVSESTEARIEELRVLLGQAVQLVTNPMASDLLAAYQVGWEANREGITFLVDEAGVIALRRFGTPAWLAYEDMKVARAFAAGEDLSAIALPQHVLTLEESAPAPNFTLLDQDGQAVHFADGMPRLIYSGLSPVSFLGAQIVEDLDALRREFAEVEFIWHRPYPDLSDSLETWRLYQDPLLANLYPETYGISLEQFTANSEDQIETYLAGKLSEIDHLLGDGWRLALDSGERLATFWCLFRTIPYILILDADGRVALPFTDYADGEWRIRDREASQDEVRQILRAITAGED